VNAEANAFFFEGRADRSRGILQLVVDGASQLPIASIKCEFGSNLIAPNQLTSVFVTNGLYFCPAPDVPWTSEVIVKLTTTNGTSYANGQVSIQLFQRDSFSRMASISQQGLDSVLQGPTSGNTTLVVYGTDFPVPSDWWIQVGPSNVQLVDAACRFTELDRIVKEVTTVRARVLSSTRLQCITPAMKKGSVQLDYTFNGLDFKTASNFKFMPCFSGEFSADYTESCQPCAVAQYQPETDQRECIWCRNTEYQNATGQSKCRKCPRNNIVSDPKTNRLSVENCQCKKGFWNNDSLTGVECKECPVNADCVGGIAKPRAVPGHWLKMPDYETIFQCVEFDACPGGIEACASGKANAHTSRVSSVLVSMSAYVYLCLCFNI
jgi:hypothetical protein